MGDAWMVALALYSLADLVEGVSFSINLPQMLGEVADLLLGNRISVGKKSVNSGYHYTARGIRHLLLKSHGDVRFVCPWQSPLKNNRKGFSGSLVLSARQWLLKTRQIITPLADDSKKYLGFQLLHCLPEFRRISEADFRQQATVDLGQMRQSLGSELASTPPAKVIRVFPGGRSFQYMPAKWAADNLKGATFYFHRSDPDRSAYENESLRTDCFDSPLDLLKLALSADCNIVTDSFPSHLAQTVSKRTIVLATHELWTRTVHPAFDGAVVPSDAICCPCSYKPRSGGARCAAGFSECVVWHSKAYSQAFRETLEGLRC